MTNVSQEQPPLISTGSSDTVARTIRTAGQTLTPALFIEGLRVFHLWQPEPAQLVWILGSIPILLAYIQNKWETRKGQKLIGASSSGPMGKK